MGSQKPAVIIVIAEKVLEWYEAAYLKFVILFQGSGWILRCVGGGKYLKTEGLVPLSKVSGS